MRARSLSRLALPVLLVSLAISVGQLQAQVPARNFRNGIALGVGYSGVIPDAPLGAGIFRLFGGRVGAFADAKISTGKLKNHEGYCPEGLGECSVIWVENQRSGDLKIRNASEWLIVNAGAVYALSPSLAVLLGAGAARKTSFAEYVDETDDPELRITTSGNYYVDNPDESGWKPQVVAGFLFRAGPSLVFRVGFESAVKGGSVGVLLVP